MSTGLTWLLSQYYEGHAVTLSAGLSPYVALTRIAGREVATVSLTRREAIVVETHGVDFPEDEFPDLDVDELTEAGMAGQGYVIRAGSWEGWAYTMQEFGGISAEHRAVEALSEATRTLGLSYANAAAWICYADDGRVLSSFDPLFPDQNYGHDPGELVRLAGAYPGDGARAEAYGSRLRWLESGLCVGIPSREADEKLLAARIDLAHLVQ